MHSVGHIADVKFVTVVSWEQGLKHIARNFSVDLTDTVYFLCQFQCQHTHREFFVLIARIEPAQSHKFFPTDFKMLAKMRHIGSHKVFFKSVMSGRNRRVCCK